MATKHSLVNWLTEALNDLGGRGTIVGVSREVWLRHEDELRGSGDLLYTWQYDLRWAAYELRREGLLRPATQSPRGVWELDDPAAG